MAYNKPSLIEVYAEFYCRSNSLPQASFFEIVPELKKIGLVDVQMGQVPAPIINSEGMLPGSIPRIRCWDKSQKDLVQLSPDRVVFNRVGDYPGWDKFEHFVRTAWACISKTVNGIHLESINLVAKDLFKAPRKDYQAGMYLNCSGEVIPKWFSDSASAIDIISGNGVLPFDGFNSQVKISIRPSPVEVEISFETSEHTRLGNQSLDSLEQQHKVLNSRFEAMITDLTREKILLGRRA